MQELRSQWHEVETLTLPFEGRFEHLLEEGDRQIEDGASLQREMPLFDAWFSALRSLLRLTIDALCSRFLAEAGRQGEETFTRVQAAIHTRCFADVIKYLPRSPGTSETAATREILWREDAASRWPDPLAELEEAREASDEKGGAEAALLAYRCVRPPEKMEIVFEQMDWTRLLPFTTQDGRFVQAEMFVERDTQANLLEASMI